jgi:hypothetical protein
VIYARQATHERNISHVRCVKKNIQYARQQINQKRFMLFFNYWQVVLINICSEGISNQTKTRPHVCDTQVIIFLKPTALGFKNL